MKEKQITKKNNISNTSLSNAKSKKEKEIENDQKGASSKKANLTKTLTRVWQLIYLILLKNFDHYVALEEIHDRTRYETTILIWKANVHEDNLLVLVTPLALRFLKTNVDITLFKLQFITI